jgi:hypothetical protein
MTLTPSRKTPDSEQEAASQPLGARIEVLVRGWWNLVDTYV